MEPIEWSRDLSHKITSSLGDILEVSFLFIFVLFYKVRDKLVENVALTRLYHLIGLSSSTYELLRFTHILKYYTFIWSTQKEATCHWQTSNRLVRSKGSNKRTIMLDLVKH